MIKRSIDILVCIFILILFFPILVITYLMILIIDRQNPFFSQIRSGQNSREFHLYKFKSMKLNHTSNKLIVTKLGKYIRLLKIDELLQIINVLKNEMSIIGPRPLYTEFDNFYKKNHRLRLKVKPGITGLAQIKIKDSTNWNIKFNYDVIYVKNLSLKLDLYILFKTIMILINSVINKKSRPIESLDYKKNFYDKYL